MFSLQSLFGRGDRFVGLLEASAEESHACVLMLSRLLASPGQSLDDFVLSRRKEKRITGQIGEELVKTFITGMEREDIEALSRALYKIPKSVEKFAERYQVAPTRMAGVDFTRQLALVEKASAIVVAMVKQLREGQDLEKTRELNERLQYIEGEADKLIVELLQELYSGRHEPLTVIVVKDLHELLEKIVDRCRDVGNVVTYIVLKNS